MMMKIAGALAALILAGSATAAWAEEATPATDKLGQCFAWAMSGQDKAVLTRWLFAGLSVNKQAAPYVKISEADRKMAFEAGAKLADRLIADDCRKEAGAALKEQRTAFARAFYVAFYTVIDDMLGDDSTAEALMTPGEFMDGDKIDAVAREAGIQPD